MESPLREGILSGSIMFSQQGAEGLAYSDMLWKWLFEQMSEWIGLQ